jgi:hypothetical protein
MNGLSIERMVDLVNKFFKLQSINADRISVSAKEGCFSESINIKVYSKFNLFTLHYTFSKNQPFKKCKLN